MDLPVTQTSIRQFVSTVGEQHHAMAGAVIAASAAQAAALGEACMNISLQHRAASLNADEVSDLIRRIGHIKNDLIDWCDRDAVAIAEFVALREAGDVLSGQQLLCDAPAEVGRLSVNAARILQDFRPLVSERVGDDLEMSLTLLTGTARAAMLLLDSNLRLWPDKALLEKYEPIRAELEQRIGQLTPVARIRRED